MSYFEELCSKIAEQQKGHEGTDVFCAGEQLKDICRDNESLSEIVLTDLSNKSMSIDKAVEGIRDFAKKHKKNGMGFCGPQDAERILRKFYGLPEKGYEPAPVSRKVDLLDFI